ncbi:hypothetical protein [Candidatus Palauibacter sp.]|uniref:hypothetical protein n=1 Tax=Candidatus Palauibacter sp. TaxID=3101350 RepID=UPI003B5AEC2F
MKLDDLGKTPKLERLNTKLRERIDKPHISGLNLHFTDDGNVQANLTVSIGRGGIGYGNVTMTTNDSRLDGIYELIEDLLPSS